MGFFKILAGAALGVGAVAVAPFTGKGSILGAIGLGASLAGAGAVAAGAGVTGAVVGGIMKDDDDIYEDGFKAGKRHERAKQEKLIKDIKQQLEKYRNDTTALSNILMAYQTVGVAVAWCDGELHSDEKRDIKEFTTGIMASHLPDHIKEGMDRISKSKPTFEDVKNRLNKIKHLITIDDLEKFDNLIHLVIESDGKIAPEEKAFLSAWKDTKSHFNN